MAVSELMIEDDCLWLIVELDGGIDECSNVIKNVIVKDSEVDNQDTPEIHRHTRVNFHRLGKPLAGTVIMTTNCLEFANIGLSELNGTESNTEAKCYLVEYKTSPCNLIHLIVHENQLIMPAGFLSDDRAIVINDGHDHRLAMKMYEHTDEDNMQSEYKKLRDKCDYVAKNATANVKELYKDSWLLIQYSSSPIVTVYSIIRARGTIWVQYKAERHRFAYIRDDKCAFQCFVLCHSMIREELDHVMTELRTFTKSVKLPFESSLPNTAVQEAVVAVADKNHCKTSTLTPINTIESDTLNDVATSSNVDTEFFTQLLLDKVVNFNREDDLN